MCPSAYFSLASSVAVHHTTFGRTMKVSCARGRRQTRGSHDAMSTASCHERVFAFLHHFHMQNCGDIDASTHSGRNLGMHPCMFELIVLSHASMSRASDFPGTFVKTRVGFFAGAAQVNPYSLVKDHLEHSTFSPHFQNLLVPPPSGAQWILQDEQTTCLLLHLTLLYDRDLSHP